MQNEIALDPRGQQGYTQLSMPSVQPVVPSNKTSGTESFVPATYGTSGMTNWMSADASPSATKSGDMSWRYPGESPTTPAVNAYSTYAGQTSDPSWSTSGHGEVPTREDMTWSGYEAPVRSLSYSSDSMTSQQAHYAPFSGRPYAPSLATTIPGVDTVSGSMDHQVALSAGAVATPEYQSWPQYHYAKPGESYGQWYGEQRHAHPAEHSEEQPPHVSSMY
ncbi:hypothetical protein DL546_008713 [Coniochaeta pulveracea]|uniref:Uncharacterized protein n=1 Tax=Coniochaeta pulveracea TaxID=177199 RepID=A0A420YER6_9PEZI|nr:hypothetical protein DL546_008713 [Coniochaeta pulveracea]